MNLLTITCRLYYNLRALTIAATAWASLGMAPLQAQPRPNEYQVEAAYMYNFGRFIKWPIKVGDPDSTFAICVLGQDPFGPSLDSALTGKVIDGRPVVTKHITRPQDAANCRILFIHSAQDSHLAEILKTLNQSAVLTVSDMPNFSQRGGMIQFVLEQNRVRFQVNLASAESARLTLSSELLKVASSVQGSARP